MGEQPSLALAPANRRRVRDIEQRLQEPFSPAANDQGVVPGWLAPALTEVLQLDMFCAYRPACRANGTWGLGERVSVGADEFFERYDATMARLPVPFLYDPLCPDRGQRNRVRLRKDLCSHGPDVRCVIEEIWPELGIESHDQIRVLVSTGSLLTAWVGGFRKEPFGERETEIFKALVPALRRSLALRRALLDAAYPRSDLDGVLAALDSPAFVVRPDGEVEYANATGAALLDTARSEIRAQLRTAVHTEASGCAVARLSSAGRSAFLVLLREPKADFERRLSAVRRAWGVTPREGEVLRWLVVGDSNKEIALRLKCHEGNVERHVTSLLRKARCDGRSRMVARFWTTP